MFICTYAYMYIWVYTGEVNAKRVRERYLQAILRQDIAYFDNVGAGEVATRIQTDTRKLNWLLLLMVSNLSQISFSKALRRRLPSSSTSSLRSLLVSSWHLLGNGAWPWRCHLSSLVLASQAPS